jgi:hypothetical protein
MSLIKHICNKSPINRNWGEAVIVQNKYKRVAKGDKTKQPTKANKNRLTKEKVCDNIIKLSDENGNELKRTGKRKAEKSQNKLKLCGSHSQILHKQLTSS